MGTRRTRPSIGERIRGGLWRGIELASPRSSAREFELRAVSVPTGMEKLFYAKVCLALDLIGKYEPRRLNRIRRDVRAIAGVAGGSHQYKAMTRSIVLSWPGVLRSTSAELAMTIIHEATHGRIIDFGVRYDEPLRARIEGICVAQEAVFARALPGGEQLAKGALEKLSQPWWSPNDLHRSNMEFARAHDLPGWALRWIDKVGHRRLRRELAAHRARLEPSTAEEPVVGHDARAASD